SAVVIHGHGTGSLKKAVRDYVKHSFYAKNFRPGEPEEGGDGVTIIQLR
ncbi:MAG TPA: Smr/MutS family protein, partial [Spirochaetota bacterium]|nr:Smr/MutS family protein [Spirochaetota bacterium]